MSPNPMMSSRPQRPLRFFMTAPQPCPYLPGREERKVFANLPYVGGPEVNDSLTMAGFRIQRPRPSRLRPKCRSRSPDDRTDTGCSTEPSPTATGSVPLVFNRLDTLTARGLLSPP